MATGEAAPKDGTCPVCGTKRRVKKDGTLWEHKGPSQTCVSTTCDGTARLPLETMPVEADTLEILVRGIVREASKMHEYQRATYVSHQILRRIGPRLRELQGEVAMLRDTVIGAKELVFGEMPERERDAATEDLHETAEDLLQRYPHLHRPER